jgi:hypothetical protein
MYIYIYIILMSRTLELKKNRIMMNRDRNSLDNKDASNDSSLSLCDTQIPFKLLLLHTTQQTTNLFSSLYQT